MAGCRPILGVDGCHLRGTYPGILLTAVAKDDNNNIFPVAWSVVKVENSETWTWFLDLLMDLASVASAITFMKDREEPVTFMSDRQKGFLDAFKTVVPTAEKRYCCRHIWSNFFKKLSGEVYRQHFWMAARASTKGHFNKAMAKIKELDKDAFKYLDNIPANSWSRHAFTPKSKSGMLLNNCCESFNAVIREARAKPILTMLEWIRRWVMNRCFKKRDGLSRFDAVIMPSVEKMIEKQREYTRFCDVNQADVWKFEVDHEGDAFVVDLEKRKCGCYRWELMGIPCCHALACIDKKRLNYEDYIHEAYHVAAYRATYAPAFHPMLGQSQWEIVGQVEPEPPAIRIMPGRPSNKDRRKEVGEEDEKKKKCGNCGVIGHNRRRCKNPPKEPEPASKGGRPKSTDPVVLHSEKNLKQQSNKLLPHNKVQAKVFPKQAACLEFSLISSFFI